MPSAEEEKANELLAKVRKEPANKVCANCNNTSRLGFGAVCTKYNTFVCDLCKSAHQSFSHRTKSVSMSVWKPDEVWPLYGSKGGGNELARATWFATMTDADRAKWIPAEGSQELEKYKKLIYAVYEEGRWKGTPRAPTPPAPGAAEPAAAPARQLRSPPRELAEALPAKPLRASSAPASAAASAVVGYDDDDDVFGDFTSQPSSAPRPVAPAKLKAAVSAPEIDLLSLDFSAIPVTTPSPPFPALGAFPAVPFSAPPPPPSSSVAPPAASFTADPFADLFAQPATAARTAAAPAPAPKNDPFAGLF